MFTCRSKYHLTAKFPNPPKENEKRRKQVRFNKKGNWKCNNSENKNDQNIYASLARMSGNDECPSENFGDNSQFTNQILDSRATCHRMPEVSDFIPGSLEDTDKHIEVEDGHHVTAKQKGKVRIKMCDNIGDPFIATLQNVLLAPDLCDRLFSIITLINSGHTCLFHKGFCTVYFGGTGKIRLYYLIVNKGIMHFWEKQRKC